MSHCKYTISHYPVLVCCLLLIPSGSAAQDGQGEESTHQGLAGESGAEGLVEDTPQAAEPSSMPVEDGPGAEPVSDLPGEEEGAEDGESRGHQGQFGARLGVAVPYVFAVKYGEGARCDDAGEEFCRRFGAAMLDLEISYGITPTIEISVLGRFGLAEDEAADAAPLALGLGVRGYATADSPAKLYFGGRAMVDLTPLDDETNPEWKSVDVGLRGEFGLQIDITRYAGVYLQLGETLSFLRGLYFVTDGSIGAQVRLP